MPAVLIAVDPGKASGFAVYDLTTRKVLEAACYADVVDLVTAAKSAMSRYEDYQVVIEQARAYRLAGNDIADTCQLCGFLMSALGGTLPVPVEGLVGVSRCGDRMYALTRGAICTRLGQSLGERVQGGGVWRALCELHGAGRGATKAEALAVASAADRAYAKASKKPADHARAATAVAFVLYLLLRDWDVIPTTYPGDNNV